MKTLLIGLIAFVSLMAGSPRVFAIDDVIHDIADHTIGHGHHHDYYSYNYGYGGYQGYSGYYAHPYYSHTHVVWAGGHHHHHSAGLQAFGIDHGHGHGHGY